VWTKPWTFKEGFLIGGGLIFAGLMLELSVGPVVWDAFAWPANGIVLAGFMVMLTVMVYLRKKVYAFQWMTTYQAAIPAMVYAVVMTIIMGLTRQQVNGTWLNNMLSFWPFVLIYVYITVILGLTIHRRLRHIFRGEWSMKRDIPFMLNHLGLFLALTTATLGNADMQRVKMICGVGKPEWRALERPRVGELGSGMQGSAIKEMNLAIELKKFIMETYDNGSPKRFASEIQILTQSGKNIETIVEVNKPYEVDGWKIYQYGYDTQMGAQSQISILELVSDPWLPWVYAGFYMMLAGAVVMTLMVLWHRLKNATSKAFGVYFGLFVIASLFAYFFFDSYNTKTLVPALQSPWFAPHVFVYIFAYTLLGVAVVIAILPPKLGGYRGMNKSMSDASSDPQPPNLGGLDSLVYVSLAFLTIGMLFGALWAKEAWGHYWSWDPKETWAAITWIAYLIYIHYRQIPRHRKRLALWMLIGSFILLQMCWWGINYLPSAQGSSVHTYSISE
jgi:ABC-type transport system involved in cytochrome c biogenesis permease subunit